MTPSCIFQEQICFMKSILSLMMLSINRVNVCTYFEVYRKSELPKQNGDTHVISLRVHARSGGNNDPTTQSCGSISDYYNHNRYLHLAKKMKTQQNPLVFKFNSM